MNKELVGYLSALLQHKVYFGTLRSKPYIRYRSYTTSEDQSIVVLKSIFGGSVSKRKYIKGRKYWDWTCYDVDPYIYLIIDIYPYTYIKDQFVVWLEKHYKMRPKLNLQINDLALSYDRYIKEEIFKKEKGENTSIYKEEKINNEKMFEKDLTYSTSSFISNEKGASKMKEQEGSTTVKEEVRKTKAFN